jgi:hypothetical protein
MRPPQRPPQAQQLVERVSPSQLLYVALPVLVILSIGGAPPGTGRQQ